MPPPGETPMPGEPPSAPTRTRLLDGMEAFPSTLAPELISDFLTAADASRIGISATSGTYAGVGSTTQSAVVNSRGQTADAWLFAAQYDQNGELHFTRRRRFDSQTYTSSTQDSEVTFNRLDGVPAAGWKGVETQASYPTADIFWDAFSDIETAEDTDYLFMGYWLYAFKDTNTGDYRGSAAIGVAAGSTDAFDRNNIPGLTGTAIYEGPATGVIMRRASATAAPETDYFNAKASLRADFGDATALGSVSGSITEGMTEGGLALPDLTLESANIFQAGNTGLGGNYQGNSGTTDEGIAFSSRWGGKLHLNGASETDHPGALAGTFGAKTVDDLQSIIGAFGVYKQ